MITSLRTRLFQSWFRFSRSVTFGVRAIVSNERGEVLVVRHTYVDGLYLPGGGVERNETAYDAIQRELIEEAGVKILDLPKLFGVYSNHHVFRNDHVVCFHIQNWQQVEMTSQGEISEVLWIDPEAPPTDCTPGTKRRLKALVAGWESDHAFW
ncbi:MAG: NUDIX domain-containing protein [Pseudomonadota bacterium]